ncbi:MAG: PHP domain-containing protein [Gemmatimonadaceae bacterium]
MRFKIPWTPLVISAVVLLSGGLAVQPVRDAAALTDVAEAYLARPTSYVALAPVSNTLDLLTLLSARQHVALVVAALLAFIVWRLARGTRGATSWRGHLVASLLFVGAIALTYAATLFLPRPMAYLVADNANILIADFHSHTGASHDVRDSWTEEDNRAWHRGAGFNVAFVTDHASVSSAERAIVNNPNPAAAGVTLLQSIEVSWKGEHVSIPGAERTYKGLLTNNMRDLDEQALALASMVGGREPIIIWNHPRDLSRLPAATQIGMPGARAIELVNGGPKDMDHVRPKRDSIVAFAERNNIALTSGSDNHGWGRVTPAWTILRIRDWRGLQGDALALEIEQAIRNGGVRATRVVERRVAHAGNPTALALTPIAAPLRMLTTLSNEERVVWILWVWLIWAGVRLRKRARQLET